MEALRDPQGRVLPARWASSAWMLDGLSCRMSAHFLLQEVRTLKAHPHPHPLPPQTTGKQREAITFVLRFLITATFHHCAEMGHGCQRHIKHLEDIWVRRTSDGPFLTKLSTQLHPPSPKPPWNFKADSDLVLRNWKVFFRLSTFLLIDEDWSCLAFLPMEIVSFLLCTCLSKN